MNLDDIVLGVGARQILLLKYLLVAMLTIYLPYLGLLTGSLCFSLAFGIAGRRTRSARCAERYGRFSKDLIRMAAPHPSILAALGLLPMVAIAFIHLQILHQAPVMTPTFLVANGITLFFGLLMVYVHQSTLRTREMGGAGFAVHMLSGVVGLLLLFKTLFTHAAGTSLLFDPGVWAVITSPFHLLFSWNVIARFLLTLALGMLLTGAAVLFFLTRRRENASEDPGYVDFAASFGKRLAIPFALLAAPLIFWNVVTLPEVSLSLNVFFFCILGLAVLMLTARALAGNRVVETFVLTLVAFFVVITTDHFTRENAIREHTSLLAAQSAQEGEGAEGVPNVIRSRGCLACHTVDGKPLLGPTFKGIFGRESTIVKNGAESVVKVDEEYVKRSILDPTSEVVKGFQPVMPPQKLSDEELKEIIEFFKKLK